MKIQNLVGTHVLTGVDFYVEPACEHSVYDYNVCRFELDGNVYVIEEDPCDDWRSHATDLVISELPCKNKFPPHEVMCCMRKCELDNDNDNDDVLEVIDIITGKVVLEIGTGAYDDWYPYFLANFSPENLAINSEGDFSK
jgi:hypothetical protein